MLSIPISIYYVNIMWYINLDMFVSGRLMARTLKLNWTTWDSQRFEGKADYNWTVQKDYATCAPNDRFEREVGEIYAPSLYIFPVNENILKLYMNFGHI